MTHNLFCYGTLKQEYYGRHHFSKPPKNVVTVDKFLITGDSFPRAVRASLYPSLANYGSRLLGELYEVTDEELANADSYEGAPTFYDKIIIDVVEYGSGKSKPDTIKDVIMYEAKEAASPFEYICKDETLELAERLLLQPCMKFENQQTMIWR